MIVLLALVWAAVLIPSILKSRLQASPIDGVRKFEETMGILESTRRPKPAASGRWIMIPRTVASQSRRRSRIIRRRRQNFTRLLVIAAATLVLGLIPRLHWLLIAHLAADLALGGYVWRLRVWKNRERERGRVVRSLHEHEESAPIAQSG